MSRTGSTTVRDLPRTAPVVHARERIRTWRLGTFGPASEEPYRRRPSDYLRVAVAVLIVAATCLHEGDLTATEHDLFVLFNRLPDSLQSLFEVVYGAGALWAVGLLVAAAFLARRRRLSRDLAISRVCRLDGWAPARRDRRWARHPRRRAEGPDPPGRQPVLPGGASGRGDRGDRPRPRTSPARHARRAGPGALPRSRGPVPRHRVPQRRLRRSRSRLGGGGRGPPGVRVARWTPNALRR